MSVVPRGDSAWQPWLTLILAALPFHFIWEMLQAPLFAGMSELGWIRGSRLCLRASFGDIGVTLLSYGVIALVRRRRAWLLAIDVGSVVGYLAIGLVITAVLERAAVYHLGRWAYSPAMPLLASIGVAPLLQWIVVPLLTLWMARRWLVSPSRRTESPPFRPE